MFGGLFGSKKPAAVPEKKEAPIKEEKKSMFGFFSKSAPEEKQQPSKPVTEPRSKSKVTENLSVIKTFRGEEPKARKLSSDESLPDLDDKEVQAAAVKIQSF